MDWISCPNCDWMFARPADAVNNRTTCPHCKGLVPLQPASTAPASRPAAPQSAPVQTRSAPLARPAPGAAPAKAPAPRPAAPVPSTVKSAVLSSPAPAAAHPVNGVGKSPVPAAPAPRPAQRPAVAAPAAVPPAAPTQRPAVPRSGAPAVEASARVVPVASSAPPASPPSLSTASTSWVVQARPALAFIRGTTRRHPLPCAIGGGILVVLVLAAVLFRSGPRSVAVEPQPNPAIEVVQNEKEAPGAAPPPAPEKPVPPAGAAPPPVPEKPVPPAGAVPPPPPDNPVRPVAWRDAGLPPASEDPDAPVLLVHAHSVDRLFDDIKILCKELGPSEQIDRILAAIAANGGKPGLPGVDATKPLGAYVHFLPGASRPEIVGLVPISDEAEFLKLLAAMNSPADRDATGLYIVRSRQLPAPVRFRFADGYAYGTFGDPFVLDDGERIPPGRLFSRRIEWDVVVTARADRLPAPMRETLLRQIAGSGAMVIAQTAGASAAQQLWANKLVELASKLTRDMFEGKAELTLRLGVDAMAREFVADLHLRGAPGSVLARNLAGLSPGPSRVGGVIAGNPALALLVHMRLPAVYGLLLAGLSREAKARVARDAGPDFGKEHEQLFKLLENAIGTGELDMALAFRGHGPGRPGVLWGLKVPDGAALDQLFRDLVAKEAPPEYRALVKFDSDSLPGAKVHRFESAAVAAEMARLGPMLGGNPILFGFSKDAIWLTGGADGRDALSVALADPSRPTPIVHFELNAKALAELISVFSPDVAKLDDVRAALTDEHPGRVRMTLEGGANLRLRASLDLALIGLAARFVNFQAQLEAMPASP